MTDLDRVVAGLRCRDVLELLADYVDGELDPSTADRVHEHLRGCDACEKFGGEYGDLVARLRAGLGVAEPAPCRPRLGEAHEVLAHPDTRKIDTRILRIWEDARRTHRRCHLARVVQRHYPPASVVAHLACAPVRVLVPNLIFRMRFVQVLLCVQKIARKKALLRVVQLWRI